MENHGIEATELHGDAAIHEITAGMSLQRGWESESDKFAKTLGPAPAMQSVLDTICPPRRKPVNELTLDVNGATLIVQYDYQPAERAVYDLDSPMCGPGCAAEVDVTDVRVLGDATDVLSTAVLEYIKSKVLAARGEA